MGLGVALVFAEPKKQKGMESWNADGTWLETSSFEKLPCKADASPWIAICCISRSSSIVFCFCLDGPARFVVDESRLGPCKSQSPGTLEPGTLESWNP